MMKQFLAVVTAAAVMSITISPVFADGMFESLDFDDFAVPFECFVENMSPLADDSETVAAQLLGSDSVMAGFIESYNYRSWDKVTVWGNYYCMKIDEVDDMITSFCGVRPSRAVSSFSLQNDGTWYMVRFTSIVVSETLKRS